MDRVLSRPFIVSSFDLDPGRKARLTTLVNYFQEMAYQHANLLGFGYEELQEKGSFWVLSRMKIRILRYPSWNEEVLVETWHRGMEGIFGLRDFRILDHMEKEVGMASSAWIILDSETRRPVRNPGEVLLESKRDVSVFQKDPGKIRIPGDLESLREERVQFSDLDILGHVNNMKYIEWCLDAAYTPERIDREVGSFEINYNGEAVLHDPVRLMGNVEDQKESYFMARRTGDQKEIFRAMMSWNRT